MYWEALGRILQYFFCVIKFWKMPSSICQRIVVCVHFSLKSFPLSGNVDKFQIRCITVKVMVFVVTTFKS